MKKYILALALTLSLVGCCTTQPPITPSVVVKYVKVAAPLPPEYLVIPAKVDDIDLSTATQRDVSDWLARSEGRTKDLETKLNQIKKFQSEQQPQISTDVPK